MDNFEKQDTMRHPDGRSMTIQEFSNFCYNGKPIEVFKNSTYQVIRRDYHSKGKPDLIWLSIKRIDKNPVHDWRELQEIKNLLVGKDCEGLELYPAEARRVDTSNQYHLWVINDPKFRFPFGFTERLVTDEFVAEVFGAKQRPFKEEQNDKN